MHNIFGMCSLIYFLLLISEFKIYKKTGDNKHILKYIFLHIHRISKKSKHKYIFQYP